MLNLSVDKEGMKSTGPSKFSRARGNKTLRLVVIGVLILIAAYMLYSVW